MPDGKKHHFIVQETLPYKDLDVTIGQLSADDMEKRFQALKQIKSFGELAGFKLILKIKNNPYKIDSYIVLALYELHKFARNPIIQNLIHIKSIRSLKELIFLETIMEVAKNIFTDKDKHVLYNLLNIVEKASIKKGKNKLFQSFCKNLKIKIYECLYKINDGSVYNYIISELQKDSKFISDFVVDALKKFADVHIVKLLINLYKTESKSSELNARFLKEIIKVIYKKNKSDFNTFLNSANITDTGDLNILSSILQ